MSAVQWCALTAPRDGIHAPIGLFTQTALVLSQPAGLHGQKWQDLHALLGKCFSAKDGECKLRNSCKHKCAKRGNRLAERGRLTDNSLDESIKEVSVLVCNMAF